ncbi:MAG: peptidase M14 [Proteobacteria bacterium]|nr:peptidase M14 [Pseudomonadota bacterium]NOG61173.1 peptidase M14 [Pseudomonadota bacterium]
MLKIINELSDKVLSLPAHRLHEELSGPTLVHLKGKKDPALFLSVLLHGNENSGWEVVKNILAKYQGQTLPRSLSIFIGNVKAARYKKRKLETQPDFNRVWNNGTEPENLMMQSVLKIMQERDIFASIDIHNNNGLNPHYACINKLGKKYLKLAREFSRMVIYFIRPTGVQSLAFAKICPAVTLECGQPGDEYGIQITTDFVDKILQLDSIEADEGIEETIDLYHTVGIIKIPNEYSFCFNGEKADIEFIKGVEKLNFEEINSDTLLGETRKELSKPLIVLDEEGQDIFDNYFYIKDNKIYSKTRLVPAMLTTDIDIIKQDCLCYLMERYDISQGEKILSDDSPLWS